MKNLLIVFGSLLVLSFVLACSNEKEAEMRTVQKSSTESHEGHAVQDEMSAEMVVDPVCNMEINKAAAFGSKEYNGNIYYFCMEADQKTFEENPEQYIVER